MISIRKLFRRHRSFMMGVFALALMIRALVPSGWMPSQSSFLSICTGEGRVTGWVDSAGKLHKSDPAQSHHDQPCAFAGVAMAGLGAAIVGLALAPLPSETSAPVRVQLSSVGHGLAAPPPPATGPPSLI